MASQPQSSGILDVLNNLKLEFEESLAKTKEECAKAEASASAQLAGLRASLRKEEREQKQKNE